MSVLHLQLPSSGLHGIDDGMAPYTRQNDDLISRNASAAPTARIMDNMTDRIAKKGKVAEGSEIGRQRQRISPEKHLWQSQDRGRKQTHSARTVSSRRRALRLASRSPVRCSKWYYRPPSPLAWHVRPLWAQGTADILGKSPYVARKIPVAAEFPRTRKVPSASMGPVTHSALHGQKSMEGFSRRRYDLVREAIVPPSPPKDDAPKASSTVTASTSRGSPTASPEYPRPHPNRRPSSPLPPKGPTVSSPSKHRHYRKKSAQTVSSPAHTAALSPTDSSESGGGQGSTAEGSHRDVRQEPGRSEGDGRFGRKITRSRDRVTRSAKHEESPPESPTGLSQTRRSAVEGGGQPPMLPALLCRSASAEEINRRRNSESKDSTGKAGSHRRRSVPANWPPSALSSSSSSTSLQRIDSDSTHGRRSVRFSLPDAAATQSVGMKDAASSALMASDIREDRRESSSAGVRETARDLQKEEGTSRSVHASACANERDRDAGPADQSVGASQAEARGVSSWGKGATSTQRDASRLETGRDLPVTSTSTGDARNKNTSETRAVTATTIAHKAPKTSGFALNGTSITAKPTIARDLESTDDEDSESREDVGSDSSSIMTAASTAVSTVTASITGTPHHHKGTEQGDESPISPRSGTSARRTAKSNVADVGVRRSSPPSAESPLSLGGRSFRRNALGSRRRPRPRSGQGDARAMTNTSANRLAERLGSTPPALAEKGRSKNGVYSRQHAAAGETYDEGNDENIVRHYVNPMKLMSGERIEGDRGDLARRGLLSGGPSILAPAPPKSGSQRSMRSGAREDSGDVGVPQGAFIKLLRRIGVLRRRWRQSRREREEAKRKRDGYLPETTQVAARSSTSALEGNDATTVPGSGGTTEAASSPRQGDERDKTSTQDIEELDPATKEELEMACRRLLDALWRSAKRGSDTLSLNVVDGRVLLRGLTASGGVGKAVACDLGIPSPKLTSPSALLKPLLPVMGGAGGPFSRAVRGENASRTRARSATVDGSGGLPDFDKGGSKDDKHEGAVSQAVLLEQAMKLAMGEVTPAEKVADTTDIVDPKASPGHTNVPTLSGTPKRQGRQNASRAHLHKELSASAGNRTLYGAARSNSRSVERSHTVGASSSHKTPSRSTSNGRPNSTGMTASELRDSSLPATSRAHNSHHHHHRRESRRSHSSERRDRRRWRDEESERSRERNTASRERRRSRDRG